MNAPVKTMNDDCLDKAALLYRARSLARLLKSYGLSGMADCPAEHQDVVHFTADQIEALIETATR
jgi:hypothetical protein